MGFLLAIGTINEVGSIHPANDPDMYDEPFDTLEEAQTAAVEFFKGSLRWVAENDPLERWWARAYGDQGAEITRDGGKLQGFVVSTTMMR